MSSFRLLALTLAFPLLCAAQTDCPNEAEVSIITEMWGEEISWNIYGDSGDIVASGGNYESNSVYVSTVCLTDSCYILELVDSFGDGWNGATISVNFAASGVMIGPLSLATGSNTAFAVGYASECNGVPLDSNGDGGNNEVWGCTDPEAVNYNPAATFDNGSCIESCDCPEVYDPVCGYDYFSGETLTFDNLCQLECVGAYLQWEGDCSEQPIYGCMDSEALNYDADATADSGWCVYTPNCDGSAFVALTSAGTALDSLTGNVFGGTTGHFEGADGPVNDFVQWYDDAGNTTSYGCLEDGCYNFYVYGGWNNGGAIEMSIDGGDPTTYVLGADEFQAVFAVGINAEDCEVFIAGCTDPEASNYDPNATEDNGSCIYPFYCEDNLIAGQLYVCTFSQGDEVSLTIVDSQGDVLYSQDGYPNLTIDYIDICLDPEECYTAIMSNNAGGDSWNGGYFWIQSSYEEWANGSLEGAASESLEFGWADDCGDVIQSDVFGCTDPSALNYTPLATIDDGSCLYDNVDSLDCGGDNLVTGIFFSNDPWSDEVSWAIMDSLGNSVLEGDGGNSNPAGFYQTCLPDGCYTLEVYDSFGDGWGGGLLVLTSGTEALTFSLEESDFASYPLVIGAGCEDDILTIWGCMDPDAMNFNASANADDASCEYGDGGPNNPGMSGWDTTVDFNIYPTPTGEIVNVLGDGFGFESPVVVRIKDMMGKLIMERTVNPSEGPAAWIFNVRNWPAGIYTAEGVQGNKVATGKILVAH
ncbi:MAG: hypothetical protein L7S63_02205 [Flavobacteriales bacterium]|nr:hypothetical protein [Flavobacteriales bacterium]